MARASGFKSRGAEGPLDCACGDAGVRSMPADNSIPHEQCLGRFVAHLQSFRDGVEKRFGWRNNTFPRAAEFFERSDRRGIWNRSELGGQHARQM